MNSVLLSLIFLLSWHMSKSSYASVVGMKGLFLSSSLHLELSGSCLEELHGVRCLYAYYSLKTSLKLSVSFVIFYKVVKMNKISFFCVCQTWDPSGSS